MQRTIKHIKRLNNSHAGNPAFEFTFTTGQTIRTKANISDAYKVHMGMIGQLVDIEIETAKSGTQRIVAIN